MKFKFESKEPILFACLKNRDVITTKISDHHPVIHDGVLFWNIMMQGNLRSSGFGFNNGFGLIESNQDYLTRLVLVAKVIAEMVYKNPTIEVISLCEGPIKSQHLQFFFQTLVEFRFMARFIRKDMFYKPSSLGQNWGLLMLVDTRYVVSMINSESIENYPQLTNRFQLWKLEQKEKAKYLALAHFPFAGDEHKTEQKGLSINGQLYCDLINRLMERYSNDSLIFCADFNFNPYLISQWQDRVLDKIPHNNSILACKHTIKTVTVDGVLLSQREKQKVQSSRPDSGLTRKLKLEHRFFYSHLNHVFVDLSEQILGISKSKLKT